MQRLLFKLTLYFLWVHSRFGTKRAKTIVVCCPLFIGDMVFTFPLLRSIKKRYPDYQLIFLCRKEFQSLAALNPDIDTVLHIDKTANSLLAVYPKISQATYFLTPMANYWIKLGRAIAAHEIWYLSKMAQPSSMPPITQSFSASPKHISEYLLQINIAMGGESNVDNSPYLRNQELYPTLVVIQCDGRNQSIKSFTTDQLANLIKLAKKYPVDIRLMGMYAPEKRLNEDRIIDVRGLTGFDDWLKDILRARLVIGLDSAAAQIRKAAGLPACILMGPAATDFFGNSPFFPSIDLIDNRNLPCRDRGTFQGIHFPSLKNCQKSACDHPEGRVCVEGAVFAEFMVLVNRHLANSFPRPLPDPYDGGATRLT
ncbi:MAG: hypothetical protein O2845_02115 [Proteobacteria bacterium]|nr:hypothetical protein [Pseudomonadota bacterium]